MKGKLILGSILALVFMLLLISLPLFADGDGWTVINTNKNIVTIENKSSEILLVRWDTYAPRPTGTEKFFTQTYIQSGEIFQMPLCETIYIKVSVDRVEREGLNYVVVKDEE